MESTGKEKKDPCSIFRFLILVLLNNGYGIFLGGEFIFLSFMTWFWLIGELLRGYGFDSFEFSGKDGGGVRGSWFPVLHVCGTINFSFLFIFFE